MHADTLKICISCYNLFFAKLCYNMVLHNKSGDIFYCNIRVTNIEVIVLQNSVTSKLFSPYPAKFNSTVIILIENYILDRVQMEHVLSYGIIMITQTHF